MAELLAQMVSAVPLRNVSWNRNRCPLDLVYQAVRFAFWKQLRKPITLDHEVNGFLPNLKIAIASHCRAWHLTPVP